MKKNLTVYAMYPDDIDEHPNDLTTEEFIKHSQFNWSLEEFETSFNSEEISDQLFIRIVEDKETEQPDPAQPK